MIRKCIDFYVRWHDDIRECVGFYGVDLPVEKINVDADRDTKRSPHRKTMATTTTTTTTTPFQTNTNSSKYDVLLEICKQEIKNTKRSALLHNASKIAKKHNFSMVSKLRYTKTDVTRQEQQIQNYKTYHKTTLTGKKLTIFTNLKRDYQKRSQTIDALKMSSNKKRKQLEYDKPNAPPPPPQSGFNIWQTHYSLKLKYEDDSSKKTFDLGKIWRLEVSEGDKDYYSDTAKEIKKECTEQFQEFCATSSYRESENFCQNSFYVKSENLIFKVWMRAAGSDTECSELEQWLYDNGVTNIRKMSNMQEGDSWC